MSFFLKRLFPFGSGGNAPEPKRNCRPGASGSYSEATRDSYFNSPPIEITETIYEIQPVPQNPKVEIVFFHGFEVGDYRQAYWTDWLSRDGSRCWLGSWLVEEFSEARILTVRYDSSLKRTPTEGRYDLNDIARNLVHTLIKFADVGQRSCPVILVGHSLGGLVMKELMVTVHSFNSNEHELVLESFLTRVKGLFFYATPHSGSRLADTIKNPASSPLLKNLKVFGTQTAELHERFMQLRARYKWSLYGLGEKLCTELGKDFYGVVVEQASAQEGMNQGFTMVDADHFNICKPRAKISLSFECLTFFIKHITEQENDKLYDDYTEEKGMFGLTDKVKDVVTRLQTTSSVGLYGMGGVGKTTLARAVLQNLKGTGHFEYTCFIENTKEIVSKYSGKALTSRMLEDLEFRGMKMSKMDLDWSNLRGKRVLLVIDGISSVHQLQGVPWKSGWLGEESRVIITSRDKNLCEGVCKEALNVEFLTEDDSRRLFVHNAFEGCNIPAFLSGKNNPMKKIVDICGNVPLALEVVGKYLCKQTDRNMWMSTLQKLKEGEPIDGDLDNRLLTCLRLSYDALAEEERNMFLDASILFMGHTLEKIMEIWTACWGNTVPSSWGNLIFKNLVKSVNKKVWVHEQFRILARNITCSKHKKIQLWARVSLPHECREILTTQSEEPNNAEGLIYMPRVGSKFTVLKQDALCQGKFPELKVLKIKCIDISGENMVLPPKLIFFSWSGAPYAKCPFHMKDLKRLSILELKHWNALEVLPNDLEHCTTLTRIQLKGCKKVKKLPRGISNLVNLKFLGLKAISMEKLPESFGKLRMLETLELGETNISRLPSSVGNLKNLRILGLGTTPLIEFPPDICCLRLLTHLDLSGTSMSYLPDAVGDMAGLETLLLSNTQLVTLPESVGNLVELLKLTVQSTALSSLPNSIGRLRDLLYLEISSPALQSLPESFGNLGQLRSFILACDGLQSLPESFGNLGQLYDICLRCNTLQSLPESFLNLGQLGELILACVALLSPSQSRGAAGGSSPPKIKLFSKLRILTIYGRDVAHLFSEQLVNALHHIDTLEALSLVFLDTVRSLPHDFGSLLPPSVSVLQIIAFEDLEELPESMGQMYQLQYLSLCGCRSLKRLPVSLWALPHLESLDLCLCESLREQSSSCLLDHLLSATPGGRESITIRIDTWMCFLNVVECFGHISSLHIKFFTSRRIFVELAGWHPTVNEENRLSECGSEWLEGDEIVESLKKMKVIYGDGTMADAAQSQVADLLFKFKITLSKPWWPRTYWWDFCRPNCL